VHDFRDAAFCSLLLGGVGGGAKEEGALARIPPGASLVQLYSAMAYAGPGIAHAVTKGLARLMQRDGFATIAEAVGSE
ncbi:MAG: dihydroorotate dehydrogenase (quinone), partial [Novosphingobium sp.]